MENDLLKISEMARLNHVSTQTLRLYDKLNLLTPEYQDKKTGYRYYKLDQCVKLDLIHALKSCRLSLEQIREIFNLRSEEVLVEILENQSRTLSEELYHLNVSRNNLGRIIKSLKAIRTMPAYGQVFYEYIPERRIDAQLTDYDFFSLGQEGYEQMLRHMQRYLHKNALPPSYFTNIGTLMEKDSFLSGNYSAKTAFILIDELYPDTESTRILPANMHLSIILDDTSLEKRFAKKLFREMTKRNMTPCGDYLCEVMTQLPLRGKGGLVYKIQIPVQPGQKKTANA